jgi:glycine cleavage system aminomethyltransferase T
MKRFVVREVETLKTTAAMYGMVCADGCIILDDGTVICFNPQ